MSDLTGTIWQRYGSDRLVRVTKHGTTHAHVHACDEQGRLRYTLGWGGLNGQVSRVKLTSTGRLQGYKRVSA